MAEDPSDPDDREHTPDPTDDRPDEDAGPGDDGPADGGADAGSPDAPPSDDEEVPTPEDVREELYGGRDGSGVERPGEGFEEGIVDLLSWGLDTETRARIYVRLRQHPGATSEELAADTGLYPDTVREVLADLHDDGVVERRERVDAGADDDAYEYTAIAPSDLVGELAERVREQFDAAFDPGGPPRDDPGRDTGRDATSTRSSTTPATEPVTITVRDADESDGSETDGSDTDDTGDANGTDDTDTSSDE